jgi:TonB-dependent SusC/RagA subfamily outer membrane receptor
MVLSAITRRVALSRPRSYRFHCRARESLATLALAALAALAGCGTLRDPAAQPAPPDRGGLAVGRDVLTREQISQINAPTMERLLDGRFAGVEVTRQRGELTLRIRSGGEPLVMLNGTPTSIGSLWALDPVDVEQVEVIKETAAAIYGLDGAHGVVLITIRR